MSSLRTSELAADPRVVRGLGAQLDERRARIAAGEEPLGWKIGFGVPATMERLGIAAPLTGYLMQAGLVEAGAPVSIDGYANAVLEPEVAAHVGPGGEVAALGPAFEVADLDPPPEDPEAILASNVFHRAVMLGPPVAGASAAELSARVTRPGGDEELVADPQSATGEVAALVRHVADLLPAFGEELRDGDVVICGSIVLPPMPVSPGDEAAYELAGIGSLRISF